MNLSELPQDVQDELLAERKELLHTRKVNTPWQVVFVNKEGTRYFKAWRKNDYQKWSGCSGWWNVRYGRIQWSSERTPLGDYEYFWMFSKTFSKSQNGTEIPREVHTKKDVLEIAKKIGIFDI